MRSTAEIPLFGFERWIGVKGKYQELKSRIQVHALLISQDDAAWYIKLGIWDNTETISEN